MKAVVLKDFGAVDQLELRDIPAPDLPAGEVLIKVHAIGINPVDAKTRMGKGQAAKLKDDHPMILGWDISGVITQKGSAVENFRVGDEVFGMIRIPGHGRAYAEFVSSPPDHIAHKPPEIPHEEAAACGIAAMTALQAIVRRGNVAAGQRVLIHAAAGGVGHFAVQIAHSLGAYVIGSSSPDNKNFVLSLGADEHIDYHAEDWETKIEPVDFVLEAMGGDNIGRSLKALKPGGTIISLPSGKSEDVKERAAADGKTGIFFTVNSNKEDIDTIAGLMAQRTVRPHVSQSFRLPEIAEAHRQIESGKTTGKIVINL